MRIWIFEGLAALPSGERFLPGEAVPLRMSEGIREAAYLGLRPDEGQLAPGPLMVSALGAEPPERSTHFHLALLSVDDDGQLSRADGGLEPGTLARLTTLSLVPLEGSGQDHGLVWEEVGALRTMTPREVFGEEYLQCLPEGDGERALRRLIDDSANLLRETDGNRRLLDEGKRPANILWPWGAGLRLPVPNLPLRRLRPARVESGSWRLAGLTRLAGYRHGSWTKPSMNSADLNVVRLPVDPEEALYDLAKWRDRAEPESLIVVLTDGKQATALRTDRLPNGRSFDERLLEEGGGGLSLWAWLDESWSAEREP